MPAKKKLGRKGSSIFNTPCRQAIYEEDKDSAKKINITYLDKSLSEQSLGIAKAIRQVDSFLQKHPTWKNKLVESHPEHCFAVLNDGIPIIEKKNQADGQRIRLEVLKRYYPDADRIVERFLTAVPSRKKIDDVLDAAALAVCGMLGLQNGFMTIPAEPMIDKTGLLMQIVVCKTNRVKSV
jgi:predicted RNase H-like nuclease